MSFFVTKSSGLIYFNPRTPLQSAMTNLLQQAFTVFISIHALRYRVRSTVRTVILHESGISIHALHYRVRRDYRYQCCHDCQKFQSTHSITECDHALLNLLTLQLSNFNPRTPLQSATTLVNSLDKVLSHFNPRTPLQSATGTCKSSCNRLGISIHALHYRVRHWTARWLKRALISFQSTHSITECDRNI